MIYAIDASGSSHGHIMMLMCQHVKNQTDATKVIYFDTKVISVIPASAIDYKDAPIGGGTDIQCVFDWMRDNAPGEDLTIVTDGYFGSKVESHGVRAACHLTTSSVSAQIATANTKAFIHIATI